jgi:DNA-binding MarR family transcriptional regulator
VRENTSVKAPISTLLSQVLVAHTIELDNEFERRFEEAGGGARVVSVVMWSNFLRFVEDGIAVGELPDAAGLPKARMLSTLGGMERWRYVFVASAEARQPPREKRDGWGSARGLRGDWVVRPTPAGRTAAAIWRELFGEIEARWEERFGADAVDELRRTLRAIVERIDVELPHFLPVIGSANGMAADLPVRERHGGAAGSLHLAGLLSQALLAYTIDFERRSELSLPLGENFLRLLDEKGISVRELPVAAGSSKEATAMALTFLAKTGHVDLEGDTASTKVAQLSPKGRELRKAWGRLHAGCDERWRRRFGADDVSRLRSSLERVLEHDDLGAGLEPHSGGWRASGGYGERTKAMVDDPRAALPHYPMVLHRGGWPDGS